MKNKTIKNTFIVLLCSILAKVFSYIWEVFLAATLGISPQADALYMTLGVFEVIYPILDMGIWKVFLPIYKKKLSQNDGDAATAIANKTITLFFVFSVLLVCVMILFASPIISIIAPGYSNGVKQLTIQYLRFLSPMYLFMTTASVVGAVLQCHNRYWGSQLREISTHISKLVFLLVFYRFLGINATIFAYIIGSVFRVLIQIPFINWEWKFKPFFKPGDSDIKQLIKDLPSIATTAAITQLNSLIDKIIASTAISGSVSSLNYGRKLISVFGGLVTNAISTAIYPTIVEYNMLNKRSEIRNLLTSAVQVSIFVILPINFYCLFFPKHIISVAFERGAFDATATAMASKVFWGYSLGMMFSGLMSIITNVFYAFGEAKIALKVSCINIILNIIFNFLFIQTLGVMGLAIATSLSSFICFFILIYSMKKYVQIDSRKIILDFIKISIASITGCLIAKIVINTFVIGSVFTLVIISGIILCFVYASFCSLFRIMILEDVKRLFNKKSA